MIRIRCPHCRQVHAAPEAFSGRRAACPSCKQVFRIGEDLTLWLEAVAVEMRRRPRVADEQPVPMYLPTTQSG